MFDLITVYHNENNYKLHLDLIEDILLNSTFPCSIFAHSNIENNIGFAKACNIEAAKGINDIIGFINPDASIYGPFMNQVKSVFDSDQLIVITGGNFNKNPVEIHGWGLNDWVCGAAMFVKRRFWEEVGGFDEQFVWAYEETDLIRRAEKMGYKCVSLAPDKLSITHSSPPIDTPEDSAYKSHWMAEGGDRYWRKWNQ